MKVNLLVCISFEVHRIFSRRTYENSQMMRKNIAENPIYVGNFCDVRITATSCCHALTTISVWQIKPLYIFNEIISWLLNIFSTIFFSLTHQFSLEFSLDPKFVCEPNRIKLNGFFVRFFLLSRNKRAIDSKCFYFRISIFIASKNLCGKYFTRKSESSSWYKINKSSSCQPSNPVRLFDILLHMMWKLKLYRQTLQNPHDMPRKKNHPTRNRRAWYRKIRFMFALFHIHIFQNNNTNMK